MEDVEYKKSNTIVRTLYFETIRIQHFKYNNSNATIQIQYFDYTNSNTRSRLQEVEYNNSNTKIEIHKTEYNNSIHILYIFIASPAGTHF